MVHLLVELAPDRTRPLQGLYRFRIVLAVKIQTAPRDPVGDCAQSYTQPFLVLYARCEGTLLGSTQKNKNRRSGLVFLGWCVINKVRTYYEQNPDAD